jgi:hypothetical protein
VCLGGKRVAHLHLPPAPLLGTMSSPMSFLGPLSYPPQAASLGVPAPPPLTSEAKPPAAPGSADPTPSLCTATFPPLPLQLPTASLGTPALHGPSQQTKTQAVACPPAGWLSQAMVSCPIGRGYLGGAGGVQDSRPAE